MSLIWFISAAIFIFALWLFWQSAIPGRDFRIACSVLAVIGLPATYSGRVSEWHLLWYTPLAIILAYLFALRHLMALSRRVDDTVADRDGDLESLRNKLEKAVQEYNEDVDEDQRLKRQPA